MCPYCTRYALHHKMEHFFFFSFKEEEMLFPPDILHVYHHTSHMCHPSHMSHPLPHVPPSPPTSSPSVRVQNQGNEEAEMLCQRLCLWSESHKEKGETSKQILNNNNIRVMTRLFLLYLSFFFSLESCTARSNYSLCSILFSGAQTHTYTRTHSYTYTHMHHL